MLIYIEHDVKIDDMTTTTTTPLSVPPGLKGLAVTDTEIGDVRGLEGFYHYRQYSAIDLARGRSLEEVWQLLLDGSLPGDATTRHRFAAEVRPARPLPPELLETLPAIGRVSAHGRDPWPPSAPHSPRSGRPATCNRCGTSTRPPPAVT